MKFKNLIETIEVLTEDIESMKKYYPNISDDAFQSYVELDPTYKSGSTQAGKYAKWILGLANRGKLDNIGHVKDVLSRFDEEKNNLKEKDIMKYKSVDEVEAMLNDENSYKVLSDRQRLRQTQKAVHNTNLDQDAEQVFNGKDWEVWVPHTYEASCKLGRGTSWCTASTESDHYYQSYTRQGKLYIIINKHNGEKYQFHFESASFMDAEDESIPIAKFLLDNRELNDYFYANLPDEVKEQIDDLKELAANDYVWLYTGTIPQNMRRVFRYIEKIIVERDVTSIPDKEFYKLIGLKEVVLHDNITSIGEGAFEDCEHLEYINLPHNLEHLGDYAFDGCVRLKSIKINSELQILPMFAFAYADAKRVEVPGNINVINNAAFCNTNLQTIILHEGVQVIGSHAFSGSDRLTNVKLPHSLNKIESRAFRNCTQLQKIIIPKEVEYMGHRVFGNCPELTIYCEAEEQPISWETDWNHRAEVVWGYKGSDGLSESLSTKIARRDNPNDFSPFGYKVDFYDGDTHIGEGSVCGIKDDNAFLYDFEVYPEHRGKGYSKEMLQFMIDKYDLKQLYVQQANTVAVNLYKKFGFKVEGEVEDDGKPVYDMIRESYKMRFKLTEGKNLEQTVQQYIDKYKKIVPAADDELHRNQVMGLIAIDPTYKEGSTTTGDYAIWILNMAIKNGWDVIGARNKLLPLLTDFMDKKSQLPNKDINSYKSAEELELALKNCTLTDRQKERKARHASSKTEKVLDTENWSVYAALNYEGALTLGRGTTWCTATSDNAAWYVQYVTDLWWDEDFEAFEVRDHKSSRFSEDEMLDFIKNSLLPEDAFEVTSLQDIYNKYSDRAVVVHNDYDARLVNPYDTIPVKSCDCLYVFINKHNASDKYQFCMSTDLLDIEDTANDAIAFHNAKDQKIDFAQFISEVEPELRVFWIETLGMDWYYLTGEDDIEEAYNMRFKLNEEMEHRYYLCGNYGLVGTPYPNPVTREEAERKLASGHLLSSWGYVHEKSTWDDGIRRCVNSYTKLLTKPEDFDRIEQQMEKHYGKSAVTESVLNEDIAAVRKNYPNISDEDFDRLIKLDPTYREGSNSVGTYGKWILNLFNKGKLDNEGHVFDILTRFEENKKNLKNKDIGKFKTLEELDDYLNDEDNYKSLSNRQVTRQNQNARRNADLGKDAELVFESSKWQVWVPHTYAASCKLGQGSSWCTASTSSDYYYNYYSKNGKLYINIDKHDEENKYQFHFETCSFMDINDSAISLTDFLNENDDLQKFYYPIIAESIGVDLTEEVHELNLEFDSKAFGRVLDYWQENYASRDSLSSEFIQQVLAGEAWELFYIDGVQQIRDSDSLPALGSSIQDALKRLGLDIDDLWAIVDGEGDDLPYAEEVLDALDQATIDAVMIGSCDDAYEDITKAFTRKSGDGYQYTIYLNSILTISASPKSIIETYLNCGEDEFPDILRDDTSIADDILAEQWASTFDCYEPHYGWNGFSESAFNEAFYDRLDEISIK